MRSARQRCRVLTPSRAIARPRPNAPGARFQLTRTSRKRRVRRIALMAAVLCLAPAAASYLEAVTERSDSSLGIRTIEWLRDNGARGLVNRIESIYYSFNTPAKGGPTLRSLPGQPGIVA